MMALVFLTMLATMGLAWLGWRRIAAALLVVGLLLYVGEFLWEIWSPEYGFRMPWIQVEAVPDSGPPGGRTA